MAYETFVCGDLTAVIGDNEAAEGGHHPGYNGVFRLTHRTQPETLFVPAYAGLNLEHIFDGHQNGRAEVFFEPRHEPMSFEKVSDTAALLHQPPTPTFGLESWTWFTFREPHYLDMEFRCVPRREAFRYGYIGLFWASYINAPEDKSLYFHGQAGDQAAWLQLCTPQHNDESTVRHLEDSMELTFSPEYPNSLFRNFSPLRYDLPLYYGLYGTHLWLLMFDRTQGIRLTHSPSGGGYNAARQTTNPAWDFQFLLPEYEVDKEYGFKARAVYRERCSRREILEEYERWRQGIKVIISARQAWKKDPENGPRR